MMNFSVVICSRGRPDILPHALAGVARLAHQCFELIVVRDPEDLQTAACIERHAPEARIGDCRPANLAMARNVALSMARGDVVAFLDDDAVPEPDWLDRLEGAYLDPGISAAGGFIRGRDGVRFQARVVLIDQFGGDHKVRRVQHNVPTGWFMSLTGANFSVRRVAALALRGFDENYAYFLEETDFLWRLRASLGRIAVIPDAEIHHFSAASAMRDGDGTPKSLYMIGRSKAYYCHVNRLAGTPIEAVAKALAVFLRHKAMRLKALKWAGRFGRAEGAAVLRELEAGLRDGAALAEAGRSLPVMYPDRGALVAYAPSNAPARRRLCVLADQLGQGARELAMSAGPDMDVTVIALIACWRRTIRFADGTWFHALPRFSGLFEGGAQNMVAREIRRIAPRRWFDMIYVASNSQALENAAAASGLPRFIPAAGRPKFP